MEASGPSFIAPFRYGQAIQSAKKNQYRWLQDPVEITKEERLKASKKRQESPTQVISIVDLRLGAKRNASKLDYSRLTNQKRTYFRF